MPKSLIIAEKPSVAKDIARALGGFQEFENFLESDQHVVSWAVGHLLEFLEPEDIDPMYKSWKLDDLPIIPEPFQLKPKQGQTKLLGALKKQANRKDVNMIVNACDAGREGELIFREIVNYVANEKPTQRLWLQSMTPASIRRGFQELRPGREYDRLGDAAQCRSEADWLIGINATRALTRRMKLRTENQAWSAGRVQTPTLALLVDRELEILRHRPEPFWRVQARFQGPDHAYDATWFDAAFKANPDDPRKDDWITDEKLLAAILDEVKGQSGVARETRKPQSESAPPLFDLTSLQREANRRLGFSARRTLAAAQKLYESHKLITYPRTDSRCLPNDYTSHVNQVIDLMAASATSFSASAKTLKQRGLENQKKIFDDGGVSDHFAIIPTTEAPGVDLGGDEGRVYDLIVRRFLAAFFPPATWTRVERITEVKTHSFRSRSRYLTEPGWYEAWGKEAAEAEGSALPPLVPGQDAASGVQVRNLTAESEADQTRPPARISEARLLTLMEHAGKQVDDEHLSRILADKGLGTPATRAEIMENLVSKQYAVRAERTLRATAKGIILIDLLRRINARRLASPELTGELEKHLREVEGGERTRQTFMDEISDYTREIVEHARNFDYDEIYRSDPPLATCPLCKIRKVYEKARFYACEGNTGKNEGVCTFSIWKEKAGRYLDRFTVTELFENRSTPQIEGFLNKRGDGYSASLRLNEECQLEVVGDAASNGHLAAATVELPVDSTPLGPCPFDQKQCWVIETPSHYQCVGKCLNGDGKRKQGAQLPRIVCKRELTREEAKQFFEGGRTPEIDDFVSKYGRNFKATLVLKDSGKHGFEFPPRAPRGRRGGKAAGDEQATTPATGKKAARATSKKAAAAEKKAASKKSPAVKNTAASKKSSASKSTVTKKATAKRKKAAAAKTAESASKSPAGREKQPVAVE